MGPVELGCLCWPLPRTAELGLPAINFISNGATGPGDWRGEVADLRVGLKALAGRGSAACVAVISSELAFMPAYNLQVRARGGRSGAKRGCSGARRGCLGAGVLGFAWGGGAPGGCFASVYALRGATGLPGRVGPVRSFMYPGI